jgi:signal transduction histidine kinase
MACESALDRISRRDVYGSLQEEIDEMRRMAREGQELARAAWRLPEEKE